MNDISAFVPFFINSEAMGASRDTLTILADDARITKTITKTVAVL